MASSKRQKLVAIYPYRDAERSKVSDKTGKALIVSCGVPGINANALKDARRVALDLITRFCGGQVTTP